MAGTDRPDWSRAVFIAGGNVVVSGTANVTVVGTPSVTVSGTANVAITNTPSVTVASGSINIGTVSGNVNVDNATGTILETGDHLTKLGTHTFTTPAAKFTFIVSTATKTYGALLLVFSPTAATPKLYEYVSIRFTATAPAFGAPIQQRLEAPNLMQAIVPCAMQGATVRVTVYCSAAPAGKTKVVVWGMTTNPGVLMRPDGRAFPVGAFHARSLAATGTLIAAPTSPRRIMLRSIGVSAIGGAVTCELAVVSPNVTGTQIVNVMINKTGSGNHFASWEAGLLLPAATLVHVSHTPTANARFTANYDICV